MQMLWGASSSEQGGLAKMTTSNFSGNFRVHPMATNSNPAPEQPAATLTREGTQCQLNVERSKSRMGAFVETAAPTAAEGTQDDG
ncbi:hypothetical protein cypCar_00015056 [Cyprinus carpio]|nr:hypothetical protein cypCar_00015056 [Cyprinus carpio]